jgi:ornithine lipid ester-linked acyl 2-hydroxylase
MRRRYAAARAAATSAIAAGRSSARYGGRVSERPESPSDAGGAAALPRASVAFPDPGAFAFVPALEAAFAAILDEVRALPANAFAPSPDSLTAVGGGHDENGWLWCPLVAQRDGAAASAAVWLARCPATARALAAVPALVDAAFSLFRPGTHLYPHHGERAGVLRCHLGLVVPAGDVAIAAGGDLRRWQPGRCLVLDDTFEHTAWNRGRSDRIVLLVTFADARGGAGLAGHGAAGA